VPRQIEVAMSPVRMEVLEQNRYLSLTVDDVGQTQAIRVKFADLAPPFDVWNGISMWVGPTRIVSEMPGMDDDTPPTMKVATLQCSPLFQNWNLEGMVHVYHQGIVPGSDYHVQVVRDICPFDIENYYSVPVVMSTSAVGDVVGVYDAQLEVWRAPNETVDVPSDVVAVLDMFQGLPDAPSKSRADVFPGVPDQIITISDVTLILDSFRGIPYPFVPGPTPCSP